MPFTPKKKKSRFTQPSSENYCRQEKSSINTIHTHIRNIHLKINPQHSELMVWLKTRSSEMRYFLKPVTGSVFGFPSASRFSTLFWLVSQLIIIGDWYMLSIWDLHSLIRRYIFSRKIVMSFFTQKEKEIITLLLEARSLAVISRWRNVPSIPFAPHRNIHIKTRTHSIPELMVWVGKHPGSMNSF
jgi:hypothetical protein